MEEFDFFDDNAEVQNVEVAKVVEDGNVVDKTEIKKCPSCGANLVWSPAEKCLMCEHCGTKVEIDLARFGEELDFADMLRSNNAWADETHVFRCNNCGAKEIISKTEIAKACPFCGTTNVVEIEDVSGLKPNAVIPFNLTKESAVERVKLWAKKRVFAPKAFKASVYPNEIHGNYTPVFTFDTDTTSRYTGVLGEYYYVDRRVNGKVITERRTRYVPISGTFEQFFDDILVQASTSVSQKTIDKLQPFTTNTCNSYSSEFLHGFTASQYSKSGEECWNEARSDIEKWLKDAILGQYTYDFVKTFSYNTSCYNIKFKYLLLPIYIGHCNWRQKLYNFYVNGRSGKVTGKTPLSPIKVGFTTLASAILAGGIIALIYLFAKGVI